MSDATQLLEGMTAASLAQEKSPTPERIRELIAALRATPLCSAVDDQAAELLAKQFEERLGVTMTIGAAVKGTDYTPWLDEASTRIDPYYWERYKKLLISKNFPAQVIATLDDVTDRILGLLQDPSKEGPWDRRGMVVGHVQSGKTANYTGLICKAADAGYKLIVVIAGIHDNLRNQTQLRIDEGFVGRDSARLLSNKADRFVGVGKFDQTRRPVTFTNSVRDFSKGMATGVGIPLQNLNGPAVFVIKKNSKTLKNLLEWLKEHSGSGNSGKVFAPMLLIDDEADNASINIRHGSGVSTINGQIRDLLKMFDRSCYVGYTATPFANIFIDPETDDEMRGADLFPQSFIVSLDPPSNYFGPTRVFLNGTEAAIRYIDDHQDLLPVTHKKDIQVESLPPSMMDAVRLFVLARAVRLCRGQEKEHCSMLVNASRFTDVQKQIRNEIHHRLSAIQASVRVNGKLTRPDALKDPEIALLNQLWNREYSKAGPRWEDVQERLHEACAPIKVVEVNSRSSGTLNYADHTDTGLSVIAVGGFSLSRGLTLEGLMVSYFLRNSMMYDTLMQMGRWFGYRPGYEDLCRIWMPEEAEGWYAHIAESIELLRDELRRMEAAGATPEQFGLKVRSHPDTLIVTARNKMGSSEELVVSIGLGNNFIETTVLGRDDMATNRHAVRALVKHISNSKELGNDAADSGEIFVSEVPVEAVLNFLRDFRNHPGSVLTDGDPVRRYIEERRDGELASWDILFAGLQKGAGVVDSSLGVPIVWQSRTAGDRSTPATLFIGNKQRVASRGIEKAGLSPEQVKTAQEHHRLQVLGQTGGDEGNINYPDWIYRAVRPRPLLIIHLLSIKQGKGKYIPGPEPVVAWSISFPRTAMEEKRVQYRVNTTWMRENYGADAEDEDLEMGYE
jgi:hypothetical protein